MRAVLLGSLLLMVAAPGCGNRVDRFDPHHRNFTNVGRVGENDVGIASEAVDRYAEENGLSRREALEQIRQEQQELSQSAATAEASYDDDWPADEPTSELAEGEEESPILIEPSDGALAPEPRLP